MDSLLTPALYMEDDGEVLGPDHTPANGSEYLKTVIAERAQCLDTVSVPIDRNKFKSKQNVFLKEPPNIKSAPRTIRPTVEWQTFQVADFSEMRMRIAKLYEDRPNVRARSNQRRHPSLESEDREWILYFVAVKTQLSTVLRMNQAALERSLEVLVQLLDDVKPGETIPHQIGQWLYSVLVCLKQPLIGDVVSTLRDLARKCADIRALLPPDGSSVTELAAPLNLFICLVSRYFRQTDLAD